MRIVYFSPHPTHDIVSNVGYSTHQREMILALRGLGHEVIPVIVGGTNEAELPPETQRGGSSAFTQSIKRIIPPILWRSVKDYFWFRHDRKVAEQWIKNAILEHQPDLVYERSEYCLKAGAKWASKLGVKHVLEVNAPCVEEWIAFEGSSLLTGRANAIERFKYQHASGLCPVSSPLGAFLQSSYGISEERIKVIPNAIRPDAISSHEEQGKKIRTSYGWNSDQVVVGFVGSILEYHGVDALVEAFIALHGQRINLKLMIVGDGALLEDLKKKISANELSDHVAFTGKVPHERVFDHIAAMDICVNPKHSWYGSPIKLFEYGAMGKAIIAPDEENIKDVLTHKRSAHLIGRTDEELRNALLKLSQEAHYREKLGAQAKQEVFEKHLWRNNAEALIEFAQTLPDR